MKKLIYIPVDERPCNYDYIVNNFSNLDDIKLVTPSKDILGYKKTPADITKVFNFINENVDNESVLVVSFDMFNYGGLCPSRLHHLKYEDIIQRVNRIKELKEQYPELKIYAFSSVMRNPKYSSNDEEPDYYEHFGREIHRRSYLNDKKQFVELESSEIEELSKISIPEIVLADYEGRRETNTKVNLHLMELLNNQYIDLMVIPQDDSAPYGYTRLDQLKLKEKLVDGANVHIYPGLDEVGIALVSKAIQDIRGEKPRVSIKYSTEKGSNIIPNYEDRPMQQTLDLHLNLFESQFVEDSEFVVCVNSAIESTKESWETEFNNGEVQLHHIEFVDDIERLLSEGKKIILVDSSYTNGSDRALVSLMDERGLFNKIESYMGWNTNANSLGTALATGFVNRDDKTKLTNIAYHLIEDYVYQSKVRMEINNNFLPTLEGANYFTLKQWANAVISKEMELLEVEINKLKFFENNIISKMDLYHPWNRMFEIGIRLELK